jgi:hypothetical protein
MAHSNHPLSSPIIYTYILFKYLLYFTFSSTISHIQLPFILLFQLGSLYTLLL